MPISRYFHIIIRIFHLFLLKLRYRKHISFSYNRLWNIDIGRNFELMQYIKRQTTLVLHLNTPIRINNNVVIRGSAAVVLGNFVTIGAGTIFECNESIKIGSDVIIAENVSIRDTDHNFSDITRPIRGQGISTSPVKIGDDVWIGYGVVITKGVEIGNGCVIGANSVVTRSIPPYSVAVGVPARVIKQRGAGS